MAYMTPFGKLIWAFIAVFTLVVVGYTILSRPTLEDCGDLNAGADLSVWEHDARCRLVATVSSGPTVSMGKTNSSAEGAARFERVRFFVRLNDAPVIAILPGGDAAVHAWYAAHDESMTGYGFTTRGHLINPDADVGYRGLGKGLRKKFGMPPDAALWLFDTVPEGE